MNVIFADELEELRDIVVCLCKGDYLTALQQKRLRDRNVNGKCTNAENRWSRVGLSTPFYADRTRIVIGQLALARPPQEYVRDVVIG